MHQVDMREVELTRPQQVGQREVEVGWRVDGKDHREREKKLWLFLQQLRRILYRSRYHALAHNHVNAPAERSLTACRLQPSTLGFSSFSNL